MIFTWYLLRSDEVGVFTGLLGVDDEDVGSCASTGDSSGECFDPDVSETIDSEGALTELFAVEVDEIGSTTGTISGEVDDTDFICGIVDSKDFVTVTSNAT